MTDEKVTKLKIVPQIPVDADEGSILRSINEFMAATGLLSDYDESDVELESAQADERKLGALNAFEKQLFVIATLLSEVSDEIAKSLEANNLEAITKIMRERGISFDEALNEFVNSTSVSDDASMVLLRQAVVTRAAAGTFYEFNVRNRFDAWDGGLIVRNGYIVYSYG